MNTITTEVLSHGIATLFGVTSSIAFYKYKIRRDREKKRKDVTVSWYNDCLDIIGRGCYQIKQAGTRSEPNHNRISNNLDTLSERLSVKARNPPDNVPTSSTKYVQEIAEAYSFTTQMAHLKAKNEGVESEAEIIEIYKRRGYSDEFDFETSLKKVARVTPGMEKLLREIEKSPDIDLTEFAKIGDRLFNSDPEELQQVLSNAADEHDAEIKSISEETLYLEFLYNISSLIYNELQHEKNQVVS